VDIVQYDEKTSFIFGLNWTVLDPSLKKDVQIKEFLKQGYDKKIIIKNDDTVTYGLAVADDFYKKDKTKKYSAAAAIANTPRFEGATALIVIEEEGDHSNVVAMVGLIKGNIVLDCMIPVSRFSEYYEGFRAKCFRANVTEKIYGSLIDLVLNLVDEFSWDNLLVQKNSLAHPKRNTALSTLRSAFILYFAAALMALALVAYLVFYAWTWWEDSNLAKESRRNALLNSPEVKYQRAVNEITGGKHFKAVDVIPSIAAEFGSFPVNFSGYTLDLITCEADKSKGGYLCNLTWRSIGGTYRDFTSAAPKKWTNIASSNVYEQKGDKPIVHKTNEIPVTAKSIPDYKKLTHDYFFKAPSSILKNRRDWLLETDLYLRANEMDVNYGSIGWKPTLSKVEVQGIPPGMSKEDAQKAQTAIYGSAFELKGAPYWMIELIPNISSELVINKFSILFNSNAMQFSTSGVVYVNKK
jgi:hypothetical protein